MAVDDEILDRTAVELIACLNGAGYSLHQSFDVVPCKLVVWIDNPSAILVHWIRKVFEFVEMGYTQGSPLIHEGAVNTYGVVVLEIPDVVVVDEERRKRLPLCGSRKYRHHTTH